MGDIIAITDSNKNIVAEYRYDPWGKVLDEESLTTIGDLNPFRYRSYYYDSDIKMYYLQSRYYDAEVGRFINCDDVSYIGVTGSEVSYNPFAYCENNPVNDSDPTGNVGLLQKGIAEFNLTINYIITLTTKSSTRKKYIYSQSTDYVANMLYGGKRISYNGCELIAVYNVLKYLGLYMPFYKIIYYAEINDWYLFPVVPTGIFGSSLKKPKQLFEEKKIKFKSYSSSKSKKFSEAIKKSKICIGSYSNKYSELKNAILNFSIHTFAFYYDEKKQKYIVFNGYGGKEYDSYNDLRKKGRFFLYGFTFD